MPAQGHPRASPHPGLEAACARLRCPHCAASLSPAGASLLCSRGHRYDIARQGYVALLPARRGQPHRGDSPEMVAARDAFLRDGHYAPIVRAIARAALDELGSRAEAPGHVVDLGAGTGHHLAALLGELPGWHGVALDASRPALRRAARAHPRIGAVACDVWRALPLHDASSDLALNVFAPRNGREVARVLSRRGAMIVVTPTLRHLRQLAAIGGMLGVEEGKQDRLRDGLASWLEPVGSRGVEFDMALGHDEVRRLVAMGPSAHHVRAGDLDRWLSLAPERLAVTASVVVETFRRRPGP